MAKTDSKHNMLEHSEAKVELYNKYLRVYLNILSRASSVEKITLFDLMCGEGVYANGKAGSPIVTLKAIKDHYYANQQKCPSIEVWFNDKGKSGIEQDKSKIERVQEAAKSIFTPDKVSIKYFQKDYQEILQGVIRYVNSQPIGGKSLIFIDPWGYKDIKPEDLNNLMKNGNTEILLFLPISFMHRFAEKSIGEDFSGGEALSKFLRPLFPQGITQLGGAEKFILSLKERFKTYLGDKYFVDSFVIERDKTNKYCLFFFTNNILGFQKMVEVKWDLSPNEGSAHRINTGSNPIFSIMEVVNLPAKIEEYLERGGVNNHDLFLYGLNTGFLPKHINPILDKLKSQGKLIIISGDRRPVKGYYLGNQDRTVVFSIQKKLF